MWRGGPNEDHSGKNPQEFSFLSWSTGKRTKHGICCAGERNVGFSMVYIQRPQELHSSHDSSYPFRKAPLALSDS